MDKTTEKVELLKKEIDTSKRWFCTIFKKKNNKAIITIPTVWEFTEDHGKVYWIVNWILWEVEKKDQEEMQKDLLDFITYRLDKEKDVEKIKAFQEMFKEFDEKYRILIGK